MEMEDNANASTAVITTTTDSNNQLVLKEDDEIPRTSGLPAPNMCLTGHTGALYTVRFSPDGQHLASAGADTDIFLWDVYGECSNFGVLKGHKNAVNEVAWNYDGMSLYSASADKLVMCWDVAYNKCIRKFKGHSLFVNSIDVTKNSEELIVSAADDCTVKLWDKHSNKCAYTIPHDYQVTSCCFNDEGSEIITGGIDGIIRIYDAKTFECRLSLPPVPDIITGVSCSPEGGYLYCRVLFAPMVSSLVNSMDNTLRIFDINYYFSGRNRCVKMFKGHSHGAEKNLIKCSWSPDLSMVGCGSADNYVYIYDSTNLEIKYCLPGHTGCVNDVQFHPLEPIIASCSTDKKIYLGEIMP